MLATFFSITTKTILMIYFCLQSSLKRKLAKHCQMLKSAISTKISTTKVFNLNLFPYLCVQYLAILKKKSQSVFNLTSEYNIGR